MIQATTTTDLLACITDAVPGIGAFVVAADGTIEQLGGALETLAIAPGAEPCAVMAAPGRAWVCTALADGSQLVVTFPGSDAERFTPWLRATLDLVGHCQELESDMESMNHSAMQLLEQVAMLGETLPRLSACETDAEIALTGLEACLVAAGVERALYLRLHPHTGLCEVLVHVVSGPGGRAVVEPYPFPELVPHNRGLVGELLSGRASAVLREVPDGGFPAPDLPEALARREVLGVPVAYDAGDEHVRLGAMLLFDRIDPVRRAHERPRLGSEQVQVALSFASMLGAVLGARTTAELGKELSLAQAIQGQILPAAPAQVPGFELAGDYRTSGEVGGDYFDYVPLADGRTLVVVADVSGHNLASGMMMVSARATLRTLAAVRPAPAQVFEDLAASMYQDLTRTERFLTALGVALRPGDDVVEVVNAGHNDLLVYRAEDGRVERLASAHTILGFLPHPGYTAQQLRLLPGDVLLLYTDGITEATSSAGEMFGEARLGRALAGSAPRGARAVVDAVLAAVDDFRNPRLRCDDITLVAVCARGHGRDA